MSGTSRKGKEKVPNEAPTLQQFSLSSKLIDDVVERTSILLVWHVNIWFWIVYTMIMIFKRLAYIFLKLRNWQWFTKLIFGRASAYV